jgi:hypothetical protein
VLYIHGYEREPEVITSCYKNSCDLPRVNCNYMQIEITGVQSAGWLDIDSHES